MVRLAPWAAVAILLLSPARAGGEKVKIEYKIKSGDTLSAIASRYGVTVEDILEWNPHVGKPEPAAGEQVDTGAFNLHVGMKLKLPGKPSGQSGTITYVVEKGDSLWSIGKKFHIKPAVIVKWNGPKAPPKAKSEPVDVEAAALKIQPGMVLKLPGKPTGGAKTVSYKVSKGDSIWTIAKKFKVKPEVLVRWNAAKLGGSNGQPKAGKKPPKDGQGYPVIQAGVKLLIHAIRPDLGERVAVLEVQEGETAKKVAARYDVDLHLLLAANFLLAKDHLDTGELLEVPLPITAKDTQSVGSPATGKLQSGERMPPGPGYIIKQPEYSWATSETITGLVTCIASVQRTFEGTPDLVIGHLSRKLGGKFKPHKSHASGRDADIGYYHSGLAPKQFMKVDGDLDLKRTARLVDCLVSSGKTQYIFMNTYIQKTLHSFFQERDAPADFLTTVFQYPHPEGKQLGIIRHEPGHDDHMHVRFACPEGDAQCTD